MTTGSEYGQVLGPGTLRFVRRLPGSLELVWSYLTDSSKRGEWLASGEMEGKVGGRVHLTFRHSNLSPVSQEAPERYRHEEGARLDGTVTRWEPPRLLAFTWNEGEGRTSEVTFELSKQGEEVLMVLTHRRLGDELETLVSVSSGWHTHLRILADRAAGRVPPPFWGVHEQYEREYEQRLAS